jgi:dTDP-glucose 4,6-dehydratase
MIDKKIIITGGLGFIGSALIRFLINKTSVHVINFDAIKYAANPDSVKGASKSERYRFIEGDICDDSLFSEVLDEFKPDGVIHLAAESQCVWNI